MEVKYVGNMKEGKIHTSEGVIFCERGKKVTVTSKQFKEITPLPDWIGVYKKVKT